MCFDKLNANLDAQSILNSTYCTLNLRLFMQNKNLMSRKNDSQNLSMFFLVFFFFCISQLQFGRAYTATFGGWTDYYNICVIALEDKFKPLESA